MVGKDGSTMATRIVTELHDDIDGSDATQTVHFALDGVDYEIDLSDRNAKVYRYGSGQVHLTDRPPWPR